MSTLTALREALAKATPGPWWEEDAEDGGWGISAPSWNELATVYWSEGRSGDPESEANARAIVLLRNHADALLAVVDAARDVLSAGRSDMEDALADLCAALSALDGEGR